MATDNGVLGARSEHRRVRRNLPAVSLDAGRRDQMDLIFRDHFLSDLIGFVYSRMGPAEAAEHFLDRIRENCARFSIGARSPLVPVILDGENAWEHYDAERPAVPARAVPTDLSRPRAIRRDSE